MMGDWFTSLLNDLLIVASLFISEAKFTAFCIYSSSETAIHSPSSYGGEEMLEPIFPTPGRLESVINGFPI